VKELIKILVSADRFCKEGNCGLCLEAINTALNMVAANSTSNNTTKATIALLAKCHAEIEIVANRINSLRKLQGEIKAGIAQQ